MTNLHEFFDRFIFLVCLGLAAWLAFSSEEASVTPGVGQVFIFLSCSLLVITSLSISLAPTRPPADSEDLFQPSTLLIPT